MRLLPESEVAPSKVTRTKAVEALSIPEYELSVRIPDVAYEAVIVPETVPLSSVPIGDQSVPLELPSQVCEVNPAFDR
jgi:hypothetical protein